MKTDKPELRLVGGQSGKKSAARKSGDATADALDAALQLQSLRDRTATLITGSRSASTRRAYACDWKNFATWCEKGGFVSLPATPDTVALYLAAHMERLKPATLQRRLVAISQLHQDAGHEPPTRTNLVRKTLGGIRREMGVAQTQKAPLLTADLRTVISLLPDTLVGKRDRALLLIGFAGGFRRSELVALNVLDIVPCADGLIVTIRKSKTDQEGKGRKIGIPFAKNEATCPVRSYRAWIAAAGIKTGAVFRPVDKHGNVSKTRLAGQGAAYVLKRAVTAAGMEPALFGGHSLRAGLVTSAAREGVSERDIMAQTGHTSERMVRKYIRESNLFKNNAATGSGL